LYFLSPPPLCSLKFLYLVPLFPCSAFAFNSPPPLSSQSLSWLQLTSFPASLTTLDCSQILLDRRQPFSFFFPPVQFFFLLKQDFLILFTPRRAFFFASFTLWRLSCSPPFFLTFCLSPTFLPGWFSDQVFALSLASDLSGVFNDPVS